MLTKNKNKKNMNNRGERGIRRLYAERVTVLAGLRRFHSRNEKAGANQRLPRFKLPLACG